MTTKAKLLASLKIWLVIHPSITLMFYLFGHSLALLPLYQRALLLTVVLVPWIIFTGVPFINFVISKLPFPTIKNNS